MRSDRVIGVVANRGVFKGPGGPVDPGVLLAGLAHTAPSPALPEWANCFHQGGELLSELLREEERSQELQDRRNDGMLGQGYPAHLNDRYPRFSTLLPRVSCWPVKAEALVTRFGEVCLRLASVADEPLLALQTAN